MWRLTWNRESRPRSRLRWFQLGLRDILAITVICALAAAWWNDRQQLVTLAERSASEAESLRNEVLWWKTSHYGVFGLVTHANGEFVQINLGLDDGLKSGDRLHVYRFGTTPSQTDYLGQIVLKYMDKDKSVGSI